MRRQKEKNRSIKNIFLTFIEIILLIVMAFSGVKIVLWAIENGKNNDMLSNANNAVKINQSQPSELDKYVVDFDELKKMNDEVVGWIRVNNTEVEYPVVQAKDNDYYLHHSLDKSNNSAGWVFADMRNKVDGSDKNLIIYGHNRKDNSMFGSLRYALEEEWCNNQENRKIVFITKDAKYMYEIFSVYTVKDENYYITTDFTTDLEYENFIKELKNRSFYNFKKEINKDNQILTLSTCNIKNHKTVIHAKLTKIETY